MKRCEEWARNFARDAIDKRYPQSLAVAHRGAETNVRLLTASKMAECVLCMDLGVDPERNVRWESRPDDGADVIFREHRIDVKQAVFGRHFLIWSVRKVGLFRTKNFNMMAFVKCTIESQTGYFQGWFTKGEFELHHRVAGPDHVLDEGTMYVHESLLHRPDGFPGRNYWPDDEP